MTKIELKNFNLDESLINKIKDEKEKWLSGYRYRIVDGGTNKTISKGKILAQMVRKHFLESKKENFKKIFLNDKNKLNRAFNIESFCKLLGISVVYNTNFNTLEKNNENANKDNDNIWGLFNLLEKKIYISSKLFSEKAIRFTIAHELGHLFIDNKPKINIFYRNKSFIGEETIINDFAANFLIDTNDLLDCLIKYKNDFFKVSNEYKVPFDTISILIEEKSKELQGL